MVCTAVFPFREDPDIELVTNERSASNVYNNVVRKLAKIMRIKKPLLKQNKNYKH